MHNLIHTGSSENKTESVVSKTNAAAVMIRKKRNYHMQLREIQDLAKKQFCNQLKYVQPTSVLHHPERLLLKKNKLNRNLPIISRTRKPQWV